MTDQELLDIYVKLADFLVDNIGISTEVVVHDTSKPNESIIAIKNSITGREIGDPLTEFAMEMVRKEVYKDSDYISNYQGRSKGRDLLSSTYFIKNGEKLAGLLCINKDLSTIKTVQNSITSLQEHYNLMLGKESACSQDLDIPVTNMINQRIAEVIDECGVTPSRLNRAEKVRIIQHLKDDGWLDIKGSVREVADQLSISVPTVYRYLKEKEQEEY